MYTVNFSGNCIIYVLCRGYYLQYNESWLNIDNIVAMKEFIYKYAEDDGELKGAYAVRRQVFVGEQDVFNF